MSVTGQTGSFDLLPEPLRIDRISSLSRVFADRPPRLLRPRVQAEDVHAIRVAQVEDVAFDAATQTVGATLVDADGDTLRLMRHHRAASPRALDVLGAALLGQAGAVRWIAGTVHHDGREFVLDPTLVAADRVVVPDVDEGDPVALPAGLWRRPTDVLDDRLRAARTLLEEAVQLGLRNVPATYPARLDAAIAGLSSLGAAGLAASLTTWRAALNGDSPTATRALLEAALRLELAGEARLRAALTTA